MARNLKPRTVVPEEIYVHRAADRQLKQTVTDMGRPPYILVARQMGKTNLLLNLKRDAEREGGVVLYVDLTNRFSLAKGFFRSILDSLGDLAGVSDDVIETILDERVTLHLDPNIEFDRHLRVILKDIPEKNVVIILDEIDSLLNVSYSDMVLAQIRSMYFSRANFPEYERLTYVLSGVVEPTDLIKDKNISPFNIGERIVLGDFSRDEVESLCRRAAIELNRKALDRVYWWSSGHPRMTWDILAEVELERERGIAVDAGVVDDLVGRLYLRSFDRAPVDHIRDLVEADQTLADAIVSIRYGKSGALDDKVRGRLYLAGITGGLASDEVRIKNRIIDAAVSESWLAQVAAGRRDLLSAATDSFAGGRYQQTIRLLDEYREGLSADTSMPSESLAQLGVSLFFEGNSNRALPIIVEAMASAAPDALAEYNLDYFRGVALLRSGRADEGVKFLERAVSEGRLFRDAAAIALSTGYLNIETPIPGRTLEVLDELLDRIAEPAYVVSPELHATAYYNRALAQKRAGNEKEAGSSLVAGMEVAPISLRPAFMLADADLHEDRRGAILTAAAELIEAERLQLNYEPNNDLAFDESILALLLADLRAAGSENAFWKLFQFTRSALFSVEPTELSLLVRLFEVAAARFSTDRVISLVKLAARPEYFDNASVGNQLTVLRYLAAYEGDGQSREPFERYFQHLKRYASDEDVAEADIQMLVQECSFVARRGRYRQAIDIASVVSRFLRTDEGSDPSYAILNQYLLVISYLSLGNAAETLRLGEALLGMIKSLPQGSVEDPSLPVQVALQTESAIVSAREMERRLLIRGLGRNTRIHVRDPRTGQERTVKLKAVEDALLAGQLEFVRTVD